MKSLQELKWTKIALINFLLVSFLGVIMRYKIGFEFPFLNQKNLQHAHSHFAFAGWVSFLLMVLLVTVIQNHLSVKKRTQFNRIFVATLICSYGMLFSFIIQGYGPISILFSFILILISFFFGWKYFSTIRFMKNFSAKKWFIAGIVFSILSTLGTFYLSYMMATKNVEQHSYLGSVYWYLHFQYNGWFFFACSGLFINYLQGKGVNLKSNRLVFWLFALACVPGYGLSVLWLDLPIWIYTVVCLAAIAQFYAVIRFGTDFIKYKPFTTMNWNGITKFLLLFVGFSLFFKLFLQLGSTIPAIAKFAFGFRPIVIAYLHLVLLGFTSLFLIAYLYYTETLKFGKWAKRGILWLVVGVILNELILAAQGIGSLSYTLIPFANEILFAIAVFIFISLLLINMANSRKEY